MSATAEARDAHERSALYNKLARRAAALAHGDAHSGDALALPRDLARRIAAAERRAHSLASAGGDSEESRRAAAVDFVAVVVTTLALHGSPRPGDLNELVSAAAAGIGIARGAANLAVFRRTLGMPDVAELPPPPAYELLVGLMLELAPAEAVSLWTSPATGRLECIAQAGEAATSRRMRVAARAVLEDEHPPELDPATHVRAVPVGRWDHNHAALVARGRPELSARLAVYLSEAASALSPFFERETLFERNAAHERSLVSACERRLTRLGCDLHDGPLQDIVALAEDLRLAREQLVSVLDDELGARVGGRFDDLEAQIVSLDRTLRDISQAIRSTSGIEGSLKHALRVEVDALNRVGTMHADVAVRGELAGLTASQSIVLFRVVQEALANARKHSRATRVRVLVRSTIRYLSVSVSDNGCGFDVDAARRSGRLGLTGVIERVRLLGGDIEIRSSLGHGTRVRATLPRWSRATEEATPVYAVTP
jgi:signal transduction histidine kinase